MMGRILIFFMIRIDDEISSNICDMLPYLFKAKCKKLFN